MLNRSIAIYSRVVAVASVTVFVSFSIAQSHLFALTAKSSPGRELSSIYTESTKALQNTKVGAAGNNMQRLAEVRELELAKLNLEVLLLEHQRELRENYLDGVAVDVLDEAIVGNRALQAGIQAAGESEVLR